MLMVFNDVLFGLDLAGRCGNVEIDLTVQILSPRMITVVSPSLRYTCQIYLLFNRRRQTLLISTASGFGVKTSQNRVFLSSTEHANLIFTSTLQRPLADKSQTIEEKEAFMFTDNREVLETQPAVKASVALKMAAGGGVTVLSPERNLGSTRGTILYSTI